MLWGGLRQGRNAAKHPAWVGLAQKERPIIKGFGERPERLKEDEGESGKNYGE
jgi:hypothetical protein